MGFFKKAFKKVSKLTGAWSVVVTINLKLPLWPLLLNHQLPLLRKSKPLKRTSRLTKTAIAKQQNEPPRPRVNVPFPYHAARGPV